MSQNRIPAKVDDSVDASVLKQKTKICSAKKQISKMIDIAIPKGSLQNQTLQLFEQAGLEVKRTEREYNARIDDAKGSTEHRGRFEAVNDPAGGCVFSFALPIDSK